MTGARLVKRVATGCAVMLGCAMCAGGVTDDEGLTFYAPFEDGAAAAVAGGDPAPTDDSKPGPLVEGAKGKGIRLSPETLLAYAIPGNYDDRRGTLSFCFKILKPEQEKNYCNLFSEDGSKGANKIYMQLMLDSGFYNRVWWRTAGESFRYSRFGKISRQPVGEWHHVLLTWDKKKATHFYVDGRLITYGSREEKRRFGRVTDSHERTVAQYDRMTFGPRTLSDYGSRSGVDTELVLDEVRIYDRMFTREEAVDAYRVYAPLAFSIGSRSLQCGSEEKVVVRVRNRGVNGETFSVSHEIAACEEAGALTTGEPREIRLAAGASTDVTIPVSLTTPGDYLLRMRGEFGERVYTKNFWICGYPTQSAQEPGVDPDLRLITEFDCTKEYGPDRFCDDGMSRVIESDIGSYRITSKDKPFSRFAYRFVVDTPETPHVAVVEYPDDHEYEMEIMIDNRGNSINQTVENGVIVGGHYPNRNRFNEFRAVFWPTSKECTIMMMNWPTPGQYQGRQAGHRLGAAAARSIRIYEVVGDLPKLPLHNLPVSEQRRTVGYQEENGTITREFSGNLVNYNNRFENVYRMLHRRMRYMNWVGQNLFVMPALHYGGAVYPSEVTGQSNRMSLYPPYFGELSLDLAREYGVKVHGNMLFLTTSALEELGTDVSADDIIAGGIDHIYNIKWDGKIDDHPSIFAGGPLYNVMHPEVRRVVLEVLDDYLDLYGAHDAFDGVNFWFWPTTPLWTGDLRCGYSDYTIRLFEEETGIDVPGSVPDPKRFTERYVFLARTDKDIRERWISWRCEKVKALWEDMLALVRKENPQAVVTLDDWTIFVEGMSTRNYTTEAWDPGDVDSVDRYHRESGLDLDIFRDVPGFLLGHVVKPNDNPLANRYVTRDFLMSPAYRRAFKNRGRTAVWLEQKRREFDNMSKATAMPDYWLPEGSGHPHEKRDGSGQKRGEKGHGGWLEKSGAIMPNSDYYLEYYAKYLADFDVREITDGGITLTTVGAEDVLQDFIRAYLTLPAEHFEVFRDVDDPVCVRHRGDRFYAVNREFYPITVTVTLAGAAGNDARLLDLPADREVIVRDGTVSFEIGPFRVRSFRMPEGATLRAVAVKIPPEKRKWLRDRYDALLEARDRLTERDLRLPPNVAKDVPWFLDSLEKAWENEQYNRVRKLLDSSWSQFIRRFSEAEKGRLQTFLQHETFDRAYFGKDPRKFVAERRPEIPPIDSGAWYDLPVITGFGSVHLYRAGRRVFAKTPTEKTEVYACYDDKAVGFLFRCYDQHMHRVVPERQRKQSDLVKIMLAPTGDPWPYYYFRVRYDNANDYNAKLDWREGELRFRVEKKRKLKYDARFVKKKEYWLGRFTIPFATLERDGPPAAGTEWRFNAARRIRQQGLDTLCCRKEFLPPKANRLHDPRTYDYLVFR